MNNSSLVNNTDRIYGQNDPLRPNPRGEYVDDEPEAILWVKLLALIGLTYGLIVAFFAMSGAIERNNHTDNSFEIGGGIMLAIFVAYIIIFGYAWFRGSSKREQMKREVVQIQLELERLALEGAL